MDEKDAGVAQRTEGRVLGTKTLGQGLGGAVAKNLPANAEMQEMQVWSLGRKDPLHEEVATQSSTLAWEVPWTEEPAGLHFYGAARIGHN